MKDPELSQRWTTPEGQIQLDRTIAICLTPSSPESQRDRPLLRFVNDKLDLRDAPLANKILNGADLSNTSLVGADLTNAAAAGATFSGSDLSNSRWSGAKLTGASLDNASGTSVFMNNADLSQCTLRGIRLSNATFENSELAGTQFAGAVLQSVNFGGATLVDAAFDSAAITQDSSFFRARCANASFEDALIGATNFAGTNLDRARFVRTRLLDVNLTDASLVSADLTGAEMSDVELTRVNLSHCTLDGVVVRTRSPLTDGSDSIICAPRDRLLNWALLRTIGRIPLFGASWTAFLSSISVINFIRWINEHEVMIDLNYPIPIPYRLFMVLLGSLLLTIGTTIYRFRCPQRVQEFSETRWVEEHSHPRLLYLQDSWRRKTAQVLALTFTAIGGILAAILIVERVLHTTCYLLKSWLPAD